MQEVSQQDFIRNSEHDKIIRSCIRKHIDLLHKELASKGYLINSHFKWFPKRYPQNKNQEK